MTNFKCSKCGEIKPESAFSKDKTLKRGLDYFCKDCRKQYQKEHYKKPQITARYAAQYKKRFGTTSGKKAQRYKNYKKNYGITAEQYNEMLQAQDCRCKICDKHISQLKSTLHIDHNHKTGKIRGLLCNACNVKLGHLEALRCLEDKHWVENANNYLMEIIEAKAMK